MLNLFKKKIESLNYPVVGKKMALDQVPDQAFAQKLLGDGVALIPTNKVFCAPCDCQVVQIFPTNHAIGLKTPLGLEVLIHIGIDTVELKGQGFKRLAQPGDKLKAGDPLVEVDLDLVEKLGKSLVTPIIVTNMECVKQIETSDANLLMQVTLK